MHPRMLILGFRPVSAFGQKLEFGLSDVVEEDFLYFWDGCESPGESLQTTGSVRKSAREGILLELLPERTIADIPLHVPTLAPTCCFLTC